MSLRFWSTSKQPTASARQVQADDLAWFENSIHGGVVIIGIFRDAIAISPSSYVKQIAEKTLNIIRGIAIASIDDTALGVDFRKLGEATAAVTATILQSYLESTNREEWPGSQLQGILEDLIETLDAIELWIATGQTRNSFVRRKYVKTVKEFQQRLSEVLERFELASLLRSYTVVPFIKKMVEEYAHSLDTSTEKWQLGIKADTVPLKVSGIMRQDNLNKEMYRLEEDSLRLKVRLILRIIEREERNRHDEARVNRLLQEKESKVEIRGLRGGDDNMERDADELLYDMLMARFSNVAVCGPNPLDRPKSCSLPPSYSSVNPAGQIVGQGVHEVSNLSVNHALKNFGSHSPQSTPSSRLSVDKPLPSIEDVDTGKSRTHLAVYNPVNHVLPTRKGSRSVASLPPGAMAPIVTMDSFLSYASSSTKRSGQPADSRLLPPYVTRPDRSLSVTPLLNGEDEPRKVSIPKNVVICLPSDEEQKLTDATSPCTQEVKEFVQPSRPPPDQEEPTTFKERVPPATSEERVPVILPTTSEERVTVILPVTSEERVPVLLPATSKERIPVILPATLLVPRNNNKLKGKEKDTTSAIQSLASSSAPSSTMAPPPRNYPPLPRGAMPPKLSSWHPVPFSEDPGSSESLPPTCADINTPSPVRSSSNLVHRLQDNNNAAAAATAATAATKTLNMSNGIGKPHRPAKDDYHLPPITVTSPISLAPLVVVEPESSQPAHWKTRPKSVGPGYEYLQRSSPHMQQYVERLADRIWLGI